jgi:hypothetical protein
MSALRGRSGPPKRLFFRFLGFPDGASRWAAGHTSVRSGLNRYARGQASGRQGRASLTRPPRTRAQYGGHARSAAALVPSRAPPCPGARSTAGPTGLKLANLQAYRGLRQVESPGRGGKLPSAATSVRARNQSSLRLRISKSPLSMRFQKPICFFAALQAIGTFGKPPLRDDGRAEARAAQRIAG